MARREIELTYADVESLAREFEQNLRNGGAFAAGVTGFTEHEEVEVAIHHPTSGHATRLVGRVVWTGSAAQPGTGLAFLGFDELVRERLRRFVAGEGSPPSLAPEPEPDGDAELIVEEEGDAELIVEEEGDAELIVEEEEDAPGPGVEQTGEGGLSLHERLRGLNTVQQRKVAAEGAPSERIALERMYGKNVWPVLLANQRITVPEVARIARMGALPLPLLDQIAGNPTWLASAVIRRALLGNPRLGGENLDRVLRATPKNELKLMLKQASLPRPIKEKVRRLIGR